MPATIPGIHHVTCITGDTQKCVDFYVSVLGLRFVKKSINQDLPDTYHIYFGDYLGSPGSAMTFFGWPTWPSRRRGSGQITTVSFAVPKDSLSFWSARLRELGIDARRTARFGVDAILLEDPDGIELELVADAGDSGWQPWNESPVDVDHQVRRFHSVTLTVAGAARSLELLQGTLGFERVGQEGNRTRLQTGAGGPSAIVDVIESPEGAEGVESQGTVHHVAWRTADGETQAEWREALVEAGRNVTPVIDRWYFTSIYFREPGGVLYEIATDGPGFTVDEPPAQLGTGLSLPPWFQVRRDRLDSVLPPIVVPTTTATRTH